MGFTGEDGIRDCDGYRPTLSLDLREWQFKLDPPIRSRSCGNARNCIYWSVGNCNRLS
jgi:hypothetical protein